MHARCVIINRCQAKMKTGYTGDPCRGFANTRKVLLSATKQKRKYRGVVYAIDLSTDRMLIIICVMPE